MSEMIEQVARALCVASGQNPDADWRVAQEQDGFRLMLDMFDPEPQLWRMRVKEARAAIEAMREPTRAIMDAHADWSRGDELGSFDADAAQCWRAMIDAALTPPPDTPTAASDTAQSPKPVDVTTS